MFIVPCLVAISKVDSTGCFSVTRRDTRYVMATLWTCAVTWSRHLRTNIMPRSSRPWKLHASMELLDIKLSVLLLGFEIASKRRWCKRRGSRGGRVIALFDSRTDSVIGHGDRHQRREESWCSWSRPNQETWSLWILPPSSRYNRTKASLAMRRLHAYLWLLSWTSMTRLGMTQENLPAIGGGTRTRQKDRLPRTEPCPNRNNSSRALHAIGA